MLAFKIINVDPREPNFLKICVIKIWSISVDQQKWLHSAIIMHIIGLWRKNKQRLSRPFIKVSICKERCFLTRGLLVALLDENVLLSLLNIFLGTKESAFIEEQTF